jgi:hypothetical protein
MQTSEPLASAKSRFFTGITGVAVAALLAASFVLTFEIYNKETDAEYYKEIASQSIHLQDRMIILETRIKRLEDQRSEDQKKISQLTDSLTAALAFLSTLKDKK